MARNKLIGKVLEDVRIIDAGSEGKGVGRHGERVVFVPYTAPGDVVDVVVTRKKSNFLEGRVRAFKERSPERTEPPCAHFGLCGGCKWQHLPYEVQLKYKHKVVVDNFKRIAGIEPGEVRPIIGSARSEYYRNKLEFTFSSRRWFEEDRRPEQGDADGRALGFHMPGMFDRVLDITHCHLQPDPSNRIRTVCRRLAMESGLDFYDTRTHHGFFRNLIVRTTSGGQVMVVLVLGYAESKQAIEAFLGKLLEEVPEISSLWYVVNTKQNDSIADLEPVHFHGALYLEEKMEDLLFRVGPKSFFQTNSEQALELYRVAREFAALDGAQNVYDLYCGTGTIALFLAAKASQVAGIEYVGEAVAHARENSELNQVSNTSFVAGDMAKVLDEDFVKVHGRPDVVVTDPPRAGMHPSVIARLLELAPSRIVYVSCNPATQARDCQMLGERYTVDVIQPVDMFPHTHHVENVALLTLKP